MKDDTKKLVRQFKKQDRQAFERIIERYSHLAASVIYNISRGTLTSEDIEETVADVFITLWKNSDKVREDNLKGYICCIAKTKAYDKLSVKKGGVMIDIDEIDLEDDFDISEEAEKNDINKELALLIDSIKEPDREILIRHYFYYQKVSVIAQRMQINPNTVKIKLRRTRNKLRQMLIERGYKL